jgi:hypothetical protein
VPLFQTGTPLHELAVFDGRGGFGRALEQFALQSRRGVDEVAEGYVDSGAAHDVDGREVLEDELG